MARTAIYQAAARLLARAQEEGAVRPDVDSEDLFTGAAAIGWVAERADPERAARILSVMTDGLSTRRE
jgi:hypothetical protein